jgi:hypothetical protein
VLDFQTAMHHLEGIETLQKFVLAYANVTPNGCRLTQQSNVHEAVLFAIWLEACAKLDVRPSDPNVTVSGAPL